MVPAEDRLLVTDHDVFGYFADRYGFEIVGVVVPGGSTLAEPSASDLDALVGDLEDAGVPRCSSSGTRHPTRWRDTVADETNGDIEIVEVGDGFPGRRHLPRSDPHQRSANRRRSGTGRFVVSWLVEPFEPEFMQRALVAGLLVVVLCSVVGTWVVLRGLTFIGDALAHGVLPGIAVAFVAGFSVTLGAAMGAAVIVAGVSVVGKRTDLREDAGVGLLFVGMLALGVIIVSREGSFATEITAFLFGDVLGVDDAQLRLLAVSALVALVAVAALHRPLLALAFDERKAATLGMRPALTRTLLLILVALVVVASFQAVGTLLVFGLLVAPPATGTLVARRVPMVMVASVAFGSVAVVTGLLASWHFDVAAGASMSATAVLIFFVVLGARDTWRWWTRRALRI